MFSLTEKKLKTHIYIYFGEKIIFIDLKNIVFHLQNGVISLNLYYNFANINFYYISTPKVERASFYFLTPINC